MESWSRLSEFRHSSSDGKYLWHNIPQTSPASTSLFTERSDRVTTLIKAGVLPHSNADPVRMVRKIDTEQWRSLSPSTVQDFISVKMKTDASRFESQELFSSDLLKSAKSATKPSLTL